MRRRRMHSKDVTVRNANEPLASVAGEGLQCFGGDSSSEDEGQPGGSTQNLAEIDTDTHGSSAVLSPRTHTALQCRAAHAGLRKSTHRARPAVARERVFGTSSRPEASVWTEIKATGLGETTRRAGTDEPDNVPNLRLQGTEQCDPTTTNVFVGNLNPTTDEGCLQRLFGQYGPIASVKVMWPRSQAEEQRGYNSGFVSFMLRRHAEDAMASLAGAKLDGRRIRLSWGRPVKRMRRPMTPPPDYAYGGSAQSHDAGANEIQESEEAFILVQAPLDLRRRRRIDLLSEFVATRKDEALDIEMAVARMDKERHRPVFEFLWNSSFSESDEACYYRWRLHSLACGSSLEVWRSSPHRLTDSGPVWSPPPCARAPQHAIEDNPPTTSNTAGQRGKIEQEGSSGCNAGGGVVLAPGRDPVHDSHVGLGRRHVRLGQREEEQLRQLLAAARPTRHWVGETMAFAIDNSRFAEDVLDRILEPFQPDRLGTTKDDSSAWLCRILVVSDILMNCEDCGVPGVFVYRNYLGRMLPQLLTRLARLLDGEPSFVTRQARGKVLQQALRMWVSASVCPAHVVDEFCEQTRDIMGNQEE